MTSTLLFLAAAPADVGPPVWTNFVLLGGMALIFWFLILGPQRKRMKEHQAKVAGLKKGDRVVTVATTRPETMLGDTAVAVHPDDDRYREVVGQRLRLPVIGRELPVIADAFVDARFGTGAVKVTPAHDPNDFACGQRHDLELIQVIGLDATMIPETCPEDFAGLDRYEARKLVVQKFDELGLLDKIDDNRVYLKDTARIPAGV